MIKRLNRKYQIQEKKRIKAGEFVITQTDKSSRFAVLSVSQYLKAGKAHTDNDKEISWDTVKYLQNQSQVLKRNTELSSLLSNGILKLCCCLA